MSLAEAIAAIGPVDQRAAEEARARHATLTKPPGSLGRLEEIGIRLAALSGRCPPPVPSHPAVAVFAADHGVAAAGVTAWPQEVTAQMAANIASGGAAINVLARQVGATVRLVDVGVGAGTADLAVGAAMTRAETDAALDTGAAVAAELVADGADCLVGGEMGIGNTTAAAALIAAGTGKPAAEVTGRGAGADDLTLAIKTDIVAAAAARVADVSHPVEVMAEVGGFEIAALAGFYVGGAAARVPVVVDGVVAGAALLTAAAISPDVVEHCFQGHGSVEPGATAAWSHFGMQPLLDLDMRLGEGTGACLAVPLIQAAARVLGEMATFADAGIEAS